MYITVVNFLHCNSVVREIRIKTITTMNILSTKEPNHFDHFFRDQAPAFCCHVPFLSPAVAKGAIDGGHRYVQRSHYSNCAIKTISAYQIKLLTEYLYVMRG